MTGIQGLPSKKLLSAQEQLKNIEVDFS